MADSKENALNQKSIALTNQALTIIPELTESVKVKILSKGLDPVIAIDGPSGSGKSSVARALSKQLHLLYIDTGAMFRALAYLADKQKMVFEEGPVLQQFLQQVQLEYVGKADRLILCQGEDLTQKIREHHVSKLASIISQLPSVRTFLLDYQRKLARQEFCVMEGRDIATVVFPQAFCKFFVTASAEIRAERRLKELQAKGEQVQLQQLIQDVMKRDETDMQRTMAPLKQATDAELIDTTGMDLQQVVALIASKVDAKIKALL